MNSPLDRIRQAKEVMADVKAEITTGKTLALGVDDVRIDYFHTETGTLITAVDLMEKGLYKECFILLRTVLEKFLYFWLMMDGRKYRYRKDWTVKPNPGSTPRDARDRTFELWKKLKAEGHAGLKNARKITKRKEEDVISVFYEEEGLFYENADGTKGDLIPHYIFILDEYDPNIKHLSKLPSVKEAKVIMSHIKQEKVQDMVYHYFIYLESMLDNLVLNNLITCKQKDMILVHYNFLSSFTHPSKNNIKLWQSTGHGTVGSYDYDKMILEHLITLYTAKFMQLYIRALVHGYRRDHKLLPSQKYDKTLEELKKTSKDLWFIDNDPHPYDIWWSDVRKFAANHRGKTIRDPEPLYYEDPYQRQKEIWKRDNPELAYHLH